MGDDTVTEAAVTTAKRDGRWRTPVSIILLVLAILFAPLTVVAAWTNAQISDTDRYVRTVAPLADRPEVQAYVATQISSAVIDQIDLDQRIGELLPPALSALGPTLSSAVDGFINSAATRFTQSPLFKTLWVDANRAAHRVVAKALTGDLDSTELSNGQLTLDIGTVLEKFQAFLVDRGFGLADRIDLSKVDKQIVIAEGQQLNDLESARNAIGLLRPLIWVFFVLLLATAIGSVVVARDRRFATARLGLGLAVAMVIIAVAIRVAKQAFLNALTGETVPKSVSASLFDALSNSLKAGFRVIFWGGLLLALLVAVLPFIAQRAGLVRPAQIVVGVLAVGLVIAWDNPTTIGLVLLAVATIAVIAAIELAHRRAKALGAQDRGGSTLSPSSAS